MATIKAYGISVDKVITVKKFKKGEGSKGKWMCINVNDNAKVGNSYETLGKYCIWVSNVDIIGKINENTDIKIESISKIYFTKNNYTYNGKQYNDIVANVNAIVKLANEEQAIEQQYDDTHTQDYAGITSDDGYDLPDFNF